MRISFLVSTFSPVRAGPRGVLTQVQWLAARHRVDVVQVLPGTELSACGTGGARRRSLQYVDQGGRVRAAGVRVSDTQAERLLALPSRIVPSGWEEGWSALTDRAVERALPRLRAHLVVTTSPGTLALSSMLPRSVPVVHVERLPVKGREGHLAALAAHAGRADRVVVSDPSSAEYLSRELGASGSRVVVLDDPLELGFRPLAPRSDRLVVAAGRLTFDQHYPTLVRAFRKLAENQPGWRLRVFGDGGMRTAIENWVRKEALADRVELPGVSLDMATEWARAGIAVGTPGRGASLSVREAMAAGLPVVAVDTPEGARHLIEHGQTGWLVAEGSDAALAAGLLRIAEDTELAARLGAAARVHATSWAPQAVMPRWEALYADVARPPRQVQAPPVGRSMVALPKTPPVIGPNGTPSECLRRTVAMLAPVAARTGGRWFMLRPLGDRPARLVLPAPLRPGFLEELARVGHGYQILSSASALGPGWPDGPLELAARALRNSGVPTLSVGPAGLPGSEPKAWNAHVDVEFWEVLADRWVAPRHNDWALDLPGDFARVPGEVAGTGVPTLALAQEPTIWDRPFPIDAVYTWVDGNDPAWAARRDRRLAADLGIPSSRQSSGRARYTSRDELRYSLRSLHMFAPWLRRIFLVTDGQRPWWLSSAQDRITVVDHTELLPPEALPTFSSHAIETALHKIPGLAEHFVYLNDDVLLGRPVLPNQLFGLAGQAVVAEPVVPVGLNHEGATPHTLAGVNNRELLRGACGVTLTRHLTHGPHPLRRSTFIEVVERFREAVDRTARTPFRSETDVAVASSLVQHYGLLTGTFVGSTGLGNQFVPLTSPTLPDLLADLLQARNVDSFCLGDSHDWSIPEARVNVIVRNFLESYFPIVAPWEEPR